jgi:hypothetical protein
MIGADTILNKEEQTGKRCYPNTSTLNLESFFVINDVVFKIGNLSYLSPTAWELMGTNIHHHHPMRTPWIQGTGKIFALR